MMKYVIRDTLKLIGQSLVLAALVGGPVFVYILFTMQP